MSLNTSKILSDALARTFSRNGLVVMAGIYVASLVGMIGFSSLVYDSFVSLWEDFIEEEPEFADLIDDPEMFFPLALDIPDAISLLLVVISIVGTVVLTAVALRAFHAGLDDELPTELVFDNIAWVSINLFVGGIIFTILWGIGLAFFVIPGIIIYVLLIYFMAAVAVEDRNFVDAFARSVSVTKGQRLQVFVLFLALFLIAIAVSIAFTIVSSFFLLVSPIAAELVDVVARSIVMVYFAGVVALSYRELTQPSEPSEGTDEDDPFEEFTPANEGAQW